MVRARSFFGCIAVAFALSACTPSFDDSTSIVSGPRLLAVQAVPPEAATGKPFALTALYVGPQGTASPSLVDWAICLLQNALGNPDPISPSCFVTASSGLEELGKGGSVSGVVPASACELFGPDSPPPAAGQPAARPTDPDATGGFYLPVRVETGEGEWSSALERIACQPSGLTQSVFNAFSNGYVLNQNPAVAALSRVDASGGTTVIAPDAPGAVPALTVSAGARSSLRVAWPACPSSVASCAGAETFIYVDPTTKQIATGRESIVASWYATAGTFDLDRVGRSGSDTSTTADNGWTAPTAKGTIHLWVVLRDARGGVGWASFTVAVE